MYRIRRFIKFHSHLTINCTVSQHQVDIIHSRVILLQSHIGIKGIVSHPDGSPQPNAQIKVSNVTDDEQEPQPIRHGVTSGKP